MSDPIVGIDLGTSNSVVAHVDAAGHAKVLADDGGYKIHPSVVSFHPNGGVVVGAAAKQRKVIDPQNTIYSVKRLIGRAFDSPEVTLTRKRVPFQIKEGTNKLPMISTRGGEFAVPEVSAIVLDHVRNIARGRLGHDVNRAVVTVPASFNDAQRSATATAGAIAGLTVMRVLNEPTAAALAYGHSRNLREVIAVYDFGGGTFDISLLRIKNQVYEVIGTAGDTFLGGDDLDERLVDRMVAKFLSENRLDLRSNEISMMRLRAVAEQTKIELSRRSRAVVRIDEIAYGPNGVPLNLQIEITRDEFVRQVADIIDKTFPVCQEALTLAGIGIDAVSDVILVGGTTKIPYVRDQVAKFFARAPRTDVNPEDAVAVGAALQASTLDEARPAQETASRPGPAAAVKPVFPSDEETTHSRAAAFTFESTTSTKGGFSLDDVTGESQRPTAGKITDLGSDTPSVMMAPSEVTPPVVPEISRTRRSTAGYSQPGSKRPLSEGDKPDTSYSVTRGGTKDSVELKPSRGKPITTDPLAPTSGEISRPPRPDPDATDPRVPIGRMPRQGQPTPPPVPIAAKRTAFGVPPGPATQTSPGVGGPPQEAGTRPSARAFSESDNFTGEGPAFKPEGAPPKTTQPMPPLPPLAGPTAPTLVALAPDFAAEVESASFGGETVQRAREAAAASTARGMGPMNTATLAASEAPTRPAVPLDPIAPPQQYPMFPPPEPAPPPQAFAPPQPLAPPAPAPYTPYAGGYQPPQALVDELQFPEPPPAQPQDFGLPFTDPFAQAFQEPAPEPAPAMMPQPVAPMRPAPVVLEVTPRGLGIATVAGFCEELIRRNSRIPAAMKKLFTTSRDRQDLVRIVVCQGESRRLDHNTVIGDLVLSDLPRKPRGETSIEVTFNLDASGILQVHARDAATGAERSVTLDLVGGMADVRAARDRIQQLQVRGRTSS